MVLTKLFNSRSFAVARKFSTLTRSARSPNVLSQLKTGTGRRFMSAGSPDISMSEGLIWICVGGIPTALFGMYITKSLRDLIEDTEAGKIIPGTGPDSRMTNDQWFEIKEKVKQAMGDEEDEDEEEAAAAETEAADTEAAETETLAAETQAEAEEPDEEFVILQTEAVAEPVTSSKDTIIFIDPPKQE